METGMNALEWLESNRGISSETAARHGVKASMGRGGGQVAGFPYLDRAGDLIGHKIRAVGDKKFWFQPSGKTKCLFNLAALYDGELSGETIYITEGEIDALSLIEVGKTRAVSMPDGWTEGLTDSGTAKLKPIFDNLAAFDGQDVVIAADTDAVGQSMARAIYGALEETAKSLRIAIWPEGCKDANDVLVQHGPRDLVEALGKSRIMSPLGLTVTGVHDLPPMPPRVVYRPKDPTFSGVLAVEMGTVNFVTGVPNHGKTTAMVAMLHSLATTNNLRIGAALFETHPRQLRNQLHRLESGRPYDARDPKSEAVAAKASRHWAVVHPQEDDGVAFDMAWVKSTIRTLALHHDCKVVLIDPWNELQHDEGARETETRYTREALSYLRRQARKYDVAVFIVAHPRKMEEGKIPKGYEIAGSSTWYDKAHLGLTVWKEIDEECGREWTEIHAWKVKDREGMGIAPGMVKLDFVPETNGYKLGHF